MSRLVVASNRVVDLRNVAQAGGLSIAVGDALKRRGGLWFGWSGEIGDDHESGQAEIERSGRVAFAKVALSQRDYDEYYLGFSNRVLWPAFHYRLDLAEFEADFIAGCRRVNGRFARALKPLLQADDLVWIHDYHLIPLAAELRAMGAGQRIGFFLHIPFPSKEILVAVPQHEWLVRSLFSYDVVGFQTERDLSNFRRYVLDEARGAVEADGRVSAYGRRIVARAFPIGIDVDAVRRMSRGKDSEQQIARLRAPIADGKHMIGVDRLDYTKGLARRFRAYRKLLATYPENRSAVTLTQIAPPSREDVGTYAEIRRELEAMTGAINGEFADFDWTPLRCIHRSLARKTLTALFRGSDVGIVTPLRDGMNLVAKEYIAAQDEADPGVLVLSRFVGAAEQLEEALIVNPYDVDGLVEAFQRALTMRPEERKERHAALFRRITEHDVFHWCDSFMAALEATKSEC